MSLVTGRQWIRPSGLAASVVYLLGFALPYAVASETATATYYRYGLVRGWLLPVLGLLAVAVYAVAVVGVGRPRLVSGVLVGVGLALAVVTWTWALRVPPEVVLGMTRRATFGAHRWALALVGTWPLLAGLWDARQSRRSG